MSHEVPARKKTLTLESLIGLGLCLSVITSSFALVETDRRISGSIHEIAAEKRVSHRLATAAPTVRNPRPRLVCLVTVDGLRADRLEAMPHLSELAASAVSFEAAAAQATHPLVSAKSLLTGKYPSSLILEETSADLVDLAALEEPETFMRTTFSGVEGTLARDLAGAGFRTAAFTDARASGLGAGFEDLDEGAADALDAVERLSAWLARAPEERAFVLLNSRQLLRDGAPSEAGYDREVERVDQALGALIDVLRESDRWEETLLVVTSGHGLSLGERGVHGHGDLYLEQLVVPLVLRFPEGWSLPAGSNQEAVELVDVLPTVLAVSGLKKPPGIDGVSMLPILFRGVRGRELLVAQTSWTDEAANPARRCVVDPGSWQVIHDARSDEVEFFALDDDPAGLSSRRPIADDYPPFVRTLLREASLRTREDL
jgi:arylsulfatase A-like enzyme